MAKLPTSLLSRRTTTTSHLNILTSSARPTTTPTTPWASQTSSHNCTQLRHATKVVRPRRPYTFTQVIQLSDGSTYMQRTTSPMALYKSTKDSRNHMLWQPHEKSLQNVELDEAGRLAAFRQRFGKSYEHTAGGDESFYVFGDLISGYARADPNTKGGGLSAKDQQKKDKKGKKK